MQKTAPGALSSLLNAFAFIGDTFGNTIVAGLLLFAFTAGGIFYFCTADRDRAEYHLAAFLTAYLVINYLSIAVFMNVLSPATNFQPTGSSLFFSVFFPEQP